MSELISFFAEHWILSSIFVFLFISVIAVESFLAKEKEGITTDVAIDLINHKNAVVIDLRAKQEFEASHIINSLNFKIDDLATNNKKLTRYQKKQIILVGGKGASCFDAAAKLQKLGFNNVSVLIGGINSWVNASLPLVKAK